MEGKKNKGEEHNECSKKGTRTNPGTGRVKYYNIKSW